MKTSEKENSSSLFNLIALLTFISGFFLIMFLKQKRSKKSEHAPLVVPIRQNKEKFSSTSHQSLSGLNPRQRKILDQIKLKNRMDPKDIYALVPNVSTRTIRRDMDTLVDLGFVLQQGSTKSTTYIYKN